MKTTHSILSRRSLLQPFAGLLLLLSSGCGVVCGDGTVEPPEECDDGNATANDGCSDLCQIEFCGDGIINLGEDCDPADNVTCDEECKRIPTCGDGFLDEGEGCDDGNNQDLDGCGATCVIPACGDGVQDKGDLCFGEPTILAVANNDSMTLADLDEDDDLDLIFSANAFQIGILKNNGAGAFGAPTLLNALGNTPISPVVADLDLDNDPDVAFANFNSNDVSVFKNIGAGVLAPPKIFSCAPCFTPISMVVTDVDLTNRPELVVASLQSDSLTTLVNNGDGTFGPAVALDLGERQGALGLINQINGTNGIGNDIVVATPAKDAISFLDDIGISANQPFPFRLEFENTTGDLPLELAVVDVIGFGNKDVVTANSADGTLTAFFGSDFGEGTVITVEVGGSPQVLAGGNLDGDFLKEELLVVDRGDDTRPLSVQVVRNIGNNKLVPTATLLTAPSNASDVVIGDLNGDFANDIIVSTDDQLFIFFAQP